MLYNVQVYEKFRRLPYYFITEEAKFGWKKKCNLWKLLTHFFLNLIHAVIGCVTQNSWLALQRRS